ncbi:MAG: histidine kinase dimerization/phospho-acceptor domain-containing protein, partial [Chloroflexota bacterium]
MAARKQQSTKPPRGELQETDVFRLAEAMVAGHRQLLDELREVFQRLPNTVERAEDLLKSAQQVADGLEAVQPAVEVEFEHARFETILDSAPHGIIFVDADTGHIRPNPAAIQLLGKTPAPNAGLSQFEGMLFRADGRPLTLETIPFTKALMGKNIPDKEFLLSRPDGSQIPVLASAAPVRGPKSKVIGAVILFQDISARKELERLREEWTSVIAHDMRQPISVIAVHADLLRRLADQRGCLAREKRALRHIKSATESLNRIVNDLLDVSRLEARRLKLDRKPIDLVALIREVAERVESVTKGHPVEFQVEGSIPSVLADPGRIEQAVGNLLSNAAKYGYPESVIRVVFRRIGDFVQTSVINQGPGIPRKEIPYLFTRFQRAKRGKLADIP